MPRVNPDRATAIGTRLAERISAERTARHWSYANLAAMVTRMGCPMHKTTIFKIEQGQPKRRITVDELVAFADAFGMKPSELLDTPDPASLAWTELRAAVERVVAVTTP